jgi:hypothetical protein
VKTLYSNVEFCITYGHGQTSIYKVRSPAAVAATRPDIAARSERRRKKGGEGMWHPRPQGVIF